MQDAKDRFLEEFAKMMTDGMGLAQGVAEEAKSFTQTQMDRLIHEFGFVRREEFEALEDRIAALEASLEALASK